MGCFVVRSKENFQCIHPDKSNVAHLAGNRRAHLKNELNEIRSPIEKSNNRLLIVHKDEVNPLNSKKKKTLQTDTDNLNDNNVTPSNVQNDRKLSILEGIERFNSEFKDIQDRIIIEKKTFIHKNTEDINNLYEFREKIGSGSYGSVFKVIHKKTALLRALKVVKKSLICSTETFEENFMLEIKVLIDTDHPNIMKIYEYFFDKINYYIVMEYIRGKDLTSFVTSMKTYSQDFIPTILKQLLSAVCYLHSKNIVHRDIKPDNIIVRELRKNINGQRSSINELQLVLIDFGNSNYYNSKKMNSIVGTPYYISPDVLKENYTEKCDVWSCGIILYTLLLGYVPFKGQNMEDTFKKILTYEINFDVSKIQPLALDLLKKMLAYDSKERCSAEEAFKHPFLNQTSNQITICEKTAHEMFDNIKSFYVNEKLQQATLSYIVHYSLSIDDLKEFEVIFKKFDINGDGRLSIDEIKEGFQLLYGNVLSNIELETILNKMDMDKDNFVEYQEFLRVALDSKLLINESNLKSAFEAFDRDNDGYLDKREMKMVLSEANDAYLKELLILLDENGDGKINFKEFSYFMQMIAKKAV